MRQEKDFKYVGEIENCTPKVNVKNQESKDEVKNLFYLDIDFLHAHINILWSARGYFGLT